MDINYYKKYEPIDGKWYIVNELGSGAFGTVFEVERRDFSHAKSALKIITIPSYPNEITSYREDNYDMDEKSISSYFYGFVKDFAEEFKLMSKLRGNSNIVSIEDYDVIEHEGEIGWDIFIRMELLTPMNKYFREHELTKSDVIKLGIDICKALEVCQKYKIIHRDIKPSNIFVSDTGEFKLGDFGVARTLEKASNGMSKKGTYTYMAPEVHMGGEYSSNIDIYSLGIVMYKLLNNNFEPFRTERTHTDEEEALSRRLRGERIPKPANADGRLAEIVLKACSYNPNDRYESPLKMRQELESILYTESEAKVIYPGGDAMDFDASTDGSADEKTVSMFDSFDMSAVEEEKSEPLIEREEISVYNEPDTAVDEPTPEYIFCTECGIKMYIPDTRGLNRVFCTTCGTAINLYKTPASTVKMSVDIEEPLEEPKASLLDSSVTTLLDTSITVNADDFGTVSASDSADNNEWFSIPGDL